MLIRHESLCTGLVRDVEKENAITATHLKVETAMLRSVMESMLAEKRANGAAAMTAAAPASGFPLAVLGAPAPAPIVSLLSRKLHVVSSAARCWKNVKAEREFPSEHVQSLLLRQ